MGETRKIHNKSMVVRIEARMVITNGIRIHFPHGGGGGATCLVLAMAVRVVVEMVVETAGEDQPAGGTDSQTVSL